MGFTVKISHMYAILYFVLKTFQCIFVSLFL